MSRAGVIFLDRSGKHDSCVLALTMAVPSGMLELGAGYRNTCVLQELPPISFVEGSAPDQNLSIGFFGWVSAQ